MIFLNLNYNILKSHTNNFKNEQYYFIFNKFLKLLNIIL